MSHVYIHATKGRSGIHATSPRAFNSLEDCANYGYRRIGAAGLKGYHSGFIYELEVNSKKVPRLVLHGERTEAMKRAGLI